MKIVSIEDRVYRVKDLEYEKFRKEANGALDKKFRGEPSSIEAFSKVLEDFEDTHKVVFHVDSAYNY